jgi:hypothetical protein
MISPLIDEIKDYFGERIGLYFAYLQHYVEALMVPALFGLITYASMCSPYTHSYSYVQPLIPFLNIVRVYEDNPESVLQPYFTAFMVIWST